jgi:hypothetical protein
MLGQLPHQWRLCLTLLLLLVLQPCERPAQALQVHQRALRLQQRQPRHAAAIPRRHAACCAAARARAAAAALVFLALLLDSLQHSGGRLAPGGALLELAAQNLEPRQLSNVLCAQPRRMVVCVLGQGSVSSARRAVKPLPQARPAGLGHHSCSENAADAQQAAFAPVDRG